MNFEAVVNLRMLRGITWHVESVLDVTSMQVAEGLIFPKSIAAVDTPELAQLQRVGNLSFMSSTFLADFALIQALQHGCGVSNFHLTDFSCVFATCAQNYMFSNNKGRKKGVSNKLYCAKYSTNIVTADN